MYHNLRTTDLRILTHLLMENYLCLPFKNYNMLVFYYNCYICCQITLPFKFTYYTHLGIVIVKTFKMPIILINFLSYLSKSSNIDNYLGIRNNSSLSQTHHCTSSPNKNPIVSITSLKSFLLPSVKFHYPWTLPIPLSI